MNAIRQERQRLRAAWPNIFHDGVACGLTGEYPGRREDGGYPYGFHGWEIEKRDAWFAGFNVGYLRRKNGVRHA